MKTNARTSILCLGLLVEVCVSSGNEECGATDIVSDILICTLCVITGSLVHFVTPSAESKLLKMATSSFSCPRRKFHLAPIVSSMNVVPPVHLCLMRSAATNERIGTVRPSHKASGKLSTGPFIGLQRLRSSWSEFSKVPTEHMLQFNSLD